MKPCSHLATSSSQCFFCLAYTLWSFVTRSALAPLQSVVIPETVSTSLLLCHYKEVSSGLHTLPFTGSRVCPVLRLSSPLRTTLSTLHECNIITWRDIHDHMYFNVDRFLWELRAHDEGSNGVGANHFSPERHEVRPCASTPCATPSGTTMFQGVDLGNTGNWRTLALARKVSWCALRVFAHQCEPFARAAHVSLTRCTWMSQCYIVRIWCRTPRTLSMFYSYAPIISSAKAYHVQLPVAEITMSFSLPP